MKTTRVFLGMLAIASLGFVSCNDDDDKAVITGDDNLGIAGTYNLIEYNTGTETDFDGNGTPHGNQMQETQCYDGSKIILNADGTMAYVIKEVVVDVTNGNSACSGERTAQGTWVLEGGTGTTAVLTANYSDNGDDYEVTINKTGSELSIYSLISQYPNINSDGDAIYTVGSVERVFNKQ